LTPSTIGAIRRLRRRRSDVRHFDDRMQRPRGGRWPRAAAGRRRGGWAVAAPAGVKRKTVPRRRGGGSGTVLRFTPARADGASRRAARPAATLDDRCFARDRAVDRTTAMNSVGLMLASSARHRTPCTCVSRRSRRGAVSDARAH
jgi:hypothetical protein